MKRTSKPSRRQSGGEARTSMIEFSGSLEMTRAPVRRSTALVSPLTEAQARYDDAIRSSRITFGVGPAGTGKTWFAAMRAAEALEKGDIEKIVITRPAVEAGENLGFLPGELDEKYEPYIRPFRDAFEEKFGTGQLEYFLRKKVIEPRPLAFLRGADIKNTWMLADEMQNATSKQMKMLLTRIGKNSKFIISGDPNQMDIAGECSLLTAYDRLRDIEGISFARFTYDDVVRDDICARIVRAYEK